jgi:hypothetical protein
VWSILNGTIINVITVLVGSLLGLSVAANVPERFRSIILQSLGLVTVTLGIDAAVLKLAETVSRFAPHVRDSGTYGARLAMVMIGSLLIGSIVGTLLRIHERIESVGTWIHGRFSDSGGGRFAEGFLTASVIFCIGPLTLLGCLQNGAHGNPSFLYIKATLDGFCAMALASTLGWGVFASVIIVFGFQGGLATLAWWSADPIDVISMALMTIVGGVILLATALWILDIKKIPVANMLPGIFLPPLIVWIVEQASPRLLLPSVAP